MSDAIDILCVAASVKHRAVERYRAAQAMQHSPAAALVGEAAWLDAVLANADVERAQRVAVEIAAAAQEGDDCPKCGGRLVPSPYLDEPPLRCDECGASAGFAP